MAMRVCPQCQSDRLINNGSAANTPKKRCQQCRYQFTRTTPVASPAPRTTKINAVLLYLSGMSMRRIAFLLRVSAQAVLHGGRACAQEHTEQPEPAGRTIVLARDARWHSQKTKRQKLWLWKALDRDPRVAAFILGFLVTGL
jgi:transposase-like protein